MAPQDEVSVYWAFHLSDEQQKLVVQLRQELQSENMLLSGEDSDYDLMRFLKARGWNFEKAREQYIEMVNWRRSQNVVYLGDSFKYPELAEVKRCYPHFYHKMDKFGRPVYIERVGMLDVSQLLKITTIDRFVMYHIWCWERLKHDKFTACSKLTGKPIFTTCVILDLKGVGLKHFTSTVQKFVRAISKIDTCYYPEHLGQMFMINTPSVFKAIWRVIEPWLDPPTRNKIRVLGKDYLEELTQVISIEDIPDFLGGRSAHPDPCVDIGPWTLQDHADVDRKGVTSKNIDKNGSDSNSSLNSITDVIQGKKSHIEVYRQQIDDNVLKQQTNDNQHKQFGNGGTNVKSAIVQETFDVVRI